MPDPTVNGPDSAGTAQVVYILYLASLVFPVISLVGLIVAYMNRAEAPEWLQTHYRFLIRTFWIGLLYSVVAGLLTTILIGFLLLLLMVVWLIIRCVKGLQALDRRDAVADPATWLF